MRRREVQEGSPSLAVVAGIAVESEGETHCVVESWREKAGGRIVVGLAEEDLVVDLAAGWGSWGCSCGLEVVERVVGRPSQVLRGWEGLVDQEDLVVEPCKNAACAARVIHEHGVVSASVSSVQHSASVLYEGYAAGPEVQVGEGHDAEVGLRSRAMVEVAAMELRGLLAVVANLCHLLEVAVVVPLLVVAERTVVVLMAPNEVEEGRSMLLARMSEGAHQARGLEAHREVDLDGHFAREQVAT